MSPEPLIQLGAAAGLRRRASPPSGRRGRPRPAAGDPKRIRGAIQRLALIFHRRWSAPILSEMLRGDTHPGGIKFITLAQRLGLSHDSLHATLKYLIAQDYVMRNPGYGHAMRPEYLLAESGYEVAPACRRLLQEAHALGWTEIILKKWSMPALYAVGKDLARFSELKAALPAITSRALTLSLKQLVAAGLLRRAVIESFPPTTMYTATAAAKPLLTVLNEFSAD